MLKAALLALSLFLMIVPAHAQSACGERKKFIDVFEKKYQEKLSATGVAGQRNLIELFVSQSGSWTMLVTQPNGMSCIVAAGSDWTVEPPKPKELDS